MFDFWRFYSGGGLILEFDGCFYGDLLTYFDSVKLLLLTTGCVFVAGFTLDCAWILLLFVLVILDYSGFGCCYTVDFFIPCNTLNPSVSCINALLATVSYLFYFFSVLLTSPYFFIASYIFFALYSLNILTHSAANVLD